MGSQYGDPVPRSCWSPRLGTLRRMGSNGEKIGNRWSRWICQAVESLYWQTHWGRLTGPYEMDYIDRVGADTYVSTIIPFSPKGTNLYHTLPSKLSCPIVIQMGLEIRQRLVLHRPQRMALSVSGRLPHAEQISHLGVTLRVSTLLDGAEPGARRACCILRAAIELLGFGTLNRGSHSIR